MSIDQSFTLTCDGCGQRALDPLGRYVKPDGSRGYIEPEGVIDMEDFDVTGRDFCESCRAAKKAGLIVHRP